MTLGHGTRVYVEGIFAYRSATYTRPAGAIDNVTQPGEMESGTPEEAVSANAGEASLFDPVAAPFAGVVTDFGVPNLGVGVAFYVPFGGSASWDQNGAYDGDPAYPGAVDGVQRWWAIEGTIRSAYATAAGAYRFENIGLSVGAGLNLVLSEVSTVRARNVDGSDNLVTGAGTLSEGRSLIDAKGTTFSASAGIIWSPNDHTWIGLSYQSQPGFGEMTMTGTLENKFGTSPATTTNVEMTQALPDVVRAGVRLRPAPRVELRVFGELARWSHFQRQCILDADDPAAKCALTETGAVDTAAGGAGVAANLRRDWHDAFGVRAGGSFWLNPATELFAGAGFDSSAVPDDTLEPALMDMNKVSASLGGRFAFLRDTLAVTATYTQVIYFTRETPVRTTVDAAPTRAPDAAGTYTQSVGALNLGVEYTF